MESYIYISKTVPVAISIEVHCKSFINLPTMDSVMSNCITNTCIKKQSMHGDPFLFWQSLSKYQPIYLWYLNN